MSTPLRALFLTTPELLAHWWPHCEKHFDRVVNEAARGEFETEDIFRLTAEGRMCIALVIEDNQVILAMAFEFIFYPRKTACNIVALGGSRLRECEHQFFVTFKEWCKTLGVTVLEASCSSSMSAILSRYGFEKTYEVVRHELSLS